MSTEAEVEAMAITYVESMGLTTFAQLTDTAQESIQSSMRAALAAVEPLIRARLARDVQAACPKHLTRDYTPVDAAYDHAAAIVRGDS